VVGSKHGIKIMILTTISIIIGLAEVSSMAVLGIEGLIRLLQRMFAA